ncbi:hypothetical protein PFISCL1PPCAC_24804, partial [Pristionchus fissidentatus]
MNRVDILLIVFLQWIYMFSSQMYMPLFLNYMPTEKCVKGVTNATSYCYKVQKKCNHCIGNCSATHSICSDEVCVDRIESVVPFHSAAEDYGHYCEDTFQTFRTETVQYTGVFVGTILFGSLSDVFGRKNILLIGLILGIPSMLLSGEINNFTVFYIFRLLTGFFTGCSMVVGWGYISELVAPDQRMHLRSFATYPMGRAIITLICYLSGDWRMANRVISIICAPLIVAIFFILPESHVWLASKGRQEEYEASIDRMNKLAGCEYFKKITVEAKAKAKMGKTLKKVIVHPVLRKRLLCLFSLWFVTFYTSYGLTLNSDGMIKTNFYVVQFILCGLLVTAKIGCSSIGILGALILVFCQQSGTIIFAIFFMLASIMIELCADICYLAVNELMPTEIRGVATGVSSMVGRIANIATAVSSVVKEKWEPGYYIILLVIGVANWLVSFFLLDETKGVDLNEV